MTAAPLPNEEIERLKNRADKAKVNRRIALMVDVVTLHALLAEIEAGRAATERVREPAASALARQLDAVIHHLNGQAYSSTLSALNSMKAALRQAAQPADLEREAAAALERQHANTETDDAWAERMAPDFVESGNAIDRALKAAQPAGRVEAAAMAWFKAGCGPGKETLALIDACRASATPPTSGAVDNASTCRGGPSGSPILGCEGGRKPVSGCRCKPGAADDGEIGR